jgi:hypothetical protein
MNCAEGTIRELKRATGQAMVKAAHQSGFGIIAWKYNPKFEATLLMTLILLMAKLQKPS